MVRSMVLRAAFAGSVILAACAPALALDDGQESIFAALGSLVGVGGKPSVDIDYRERPPLVLPPKMQLRQPQKPVAERSAAWPVDPDVAAAKQAEADAKLPIFFSDAKTAGRTLTKQELLRDRVAAQRNPAGEGNRCSSDGKNCTRWNPYEGAPLEAKNQVTLGEEPERASLTEPPKGYRAATRTVKATSEGPRAAEDNSARSFYKQRQRTDE